MSNPGGRHSQKVPLAKAPPAAAINARPANSIEDYLHNEFRNAQVDGSGRIVGGTNAMYFNKTLDDAKVLGQKNWNGNHSAGHGDGGGLTSGSADTAVGTSAGASRSSAPSPSSVAGAPVAPSVAHPSPTGSQPGNPDPWTNGTFKPAGERLAEMNNQTGAYAPRAGTGPGALGRSALGDNYQEFRDLGLSPTGQPSNAAMQDAINKPLPVTTNAFGSNTVKQPDGSIASARNASTFDPTLITPSKADSDMLAGIKTPDISGKAGQPGGFSLSTGVAQPDSGVAAGNISPTSTAATPPVTEPGLALQNQTPQVTKPFVEPDLLGQEPYATAASFANAKMAVNQPPEEAPLNKYVVPVMDAVGGAVKGAYNDVASRVADNWNGTRLQQMLHPSPTGLAAGSPGATPNPQNSISPTPPMEDEDGKKGNKTAGN